MRWKMQNCLNKQFSNANYWKPIMNRFKITNRSLICSESGMFLKFALFSVDFDKKYFFSVYFNIKIVENTIKIFDNDANQFVPNPNPIFIFLCWFLGNIIPVKCSQYFIHLSRRRTWKIWRLFFVFKGKWIFSGQSDGNVKIGYRYLSCNQHQPSPTSVTNINVLW